MTKSSLKITLSLVHSEWPELHQSPDLEKEWPVGCNMRCSCPGGISLRYVTPTKRCAGCVGGAEAPWHAPDRMQVRFMNQTATILRLAQDSALGKAATVPCEALP